MRSMFLLLAEKIIRDADTNSISVINLLENMNVRRFPLSFSSLYLFSLLEKNNDEEDLDKVFFTITIDGEGFITGHIPVYFEQKRTTRVIGLMEDISFPEPGYVELLMYTEDNILLDEYSFTIRTTDQIP